MAAENANNSKQKQVIKCCVFNYVSNSTSVSKGYVDKFTAAGLSNVTEKKLRSTRCSVESLVGANYVGTYSATLNASRGGMVTHSSP